MILIIKTRVATIFMQLDSFKYEIQIEIVKFYDGFIKM